MPFIYIDHGSTVNRPYHSVKSSNVEAVSHSAAGSHVHERDSKQGDQQHSPQHHQDQQAIEEYQASNETLNTIKKVKRADEIMTSPVEVLDLSRQTPQSAWQKMQQLHIRHLPVTQNEKLVGIVCERDLLLHMMRAGELPDQLDKIMIQRVHAALPDTDIHQLAHHMFDQHIGALPIVDEQQKVVGIVTRSDILKVMSAYGPLEYWA